MASLTELLPLLLFLLATGALAGAIAGLLGVGGGIVLVPAFYFIFDSLGYGGDQVMQVCLGTSLATIIVTSARSLQSHHKKGAVDWQIIRKWAPGIVVGAIAGVLVASMLRSVYLQALFGGLGIIVSLYLGLGKAHWRLAQQMPQGILSAGLSSILGLLSVLMGIGGGSLGVPLMSLCNVAIHRAVATAAGFGLAIALPSAPGFLLLSVDEASRPPVTLGAVNLPAFSIVICMTILTAPYGAKLAHRLDPEPLRRMFAAFLLLVALNMFRKALGW